MSITCYCRFFGGISVRVMRKHILHHSSVLVSVLRAGTNILSSPLGATWLQRLYRTRQSSSTTAAAARDNGLPVGGRSRSGSGSDNMEGDDDSEEESGESETEASKPGEETESKTDKMEVVDGQAEVQLEGNDPFAAHLVAHAGCTRKLWRSRYLALREVRWCWALRLVF